MVTIVKHEWHSVDSRFAYELTKDILEQIYPDMEEDELNELWLQVESGDADLDDILGEAWDNDVDIEWDRQYDDWWTERKGGYDVTYEYGDEDSWVEPQKEPEPTHKCTKCRWTGQSYNTLTQHLRADGTVIEDYYSSDEEASSEKDVCPMCDSDVELTPEGIQEEKERQERMARWKKEEEESEELVPCYSCGLEHKESELPELNGQLYCPDCQEGWVMMENREETPVDAIDLEDVLEELKQEFESLMVAEESSNVVEMKCTNCEWVGDWTDTDSKDTDLEVVDICPECGSLVEEVPKKEDTNE